MKLENQRIIPGSGCKYTIEQFLGEGAMSDVYLASKLPFSLGDTLMGGGEMHQEHPPEFVALKIPKIFANPQAEYLKERFWQEVTSLKEVSQDSTNKHIAKIFDAGFFMEGKQKKLYMAMEFLEGKDLEVLLKEAQFDDKEAKDRLRWFEVAETMAQIAEGLQKVHNLEVIHRDIKPSNIIVTREGVAKLTDFGLGRVREGQGLTMTGDIIGSPNYMSPEQARGEELDHKTDIYSLGATLYKLITGKSPYEKYFMGDASVYVDCIGDPKILPTPLLELAPDTSVELVRIIEKAMHQDSKKRYLYADLMKEDLRNLIAGRTKKGITRRDVLVGGVGVGLGLFLGGVANFFSTPEQPRVVRQKKVFSRDVYRPIKERYDLLEPQRVNREIMIGSNEFFIQTGDEKTVNKTLLDIENMDLQLEREYTQLLTQFELAEQTGKKSTITEQVTDMLKFLILRYERRMDSRSTAYLNKLKSIAPEDSFVEGKGTIAFTIEQGADVSIYRFENKNGVLPCRLLKENMQLPKEKELPVGSYLLKVHQKNMYPELYIPFMVERETTHTKTINMLSQKERIHGMMYVYDNIVLFGEEKVPTFVKTFGIGSRPESLGVYTSRVQDPEHGPRLVKDSTTISLYQKQGNTLVPNTEGMALLGDDNVNIDPNQPVVYVSRSDAQEYIRALSNASGRTLALPTEEQLEAMMRGVDGRTYPWGYTHNREAIARHLEDSTLNKYETPTGVNVKEILNIREWTQSNTNYGAVVKGFNERMVTEAGVEARSIVSEDITAQDITFRYVHIPK